MWGRLLLAAALVRSLSVGCDCRSQGELEPDAGSDAGLDAGFDAGRQDAGPGGIRFVQSTTRYLDGGTSSVPLLTQAGDLLIVTVAFSGAAQIVGVTDDQQNVFTLAVDGGVNDTHAIYYALHVDAGPDLVHVTLSQPVAAALAHVLEYSGVSALDATANTSGVGTHGSATLVTGVDGELLYAYCGSRDVAISDAGPEWTQREAVGGNIAADRRVPDAGTWSADFYMANGTWNILMAGFKP